MSRLANIIRRIDSFVVAGRRDELVSFLTGEPSWFQDLPIFTQALPGCYERHLIGKTPYMEVYVMNWGTGANTGVHSHPKGGCWLRLLDGSLVEARDDAKTVLKPGYVGFLQGDETHAISCLEERGAVSLHVYSPRSLIYTGR